MTGSDSLGNLHLSVTTILLQDFTSSESCVSDLKKKRISQFEKKFLPSWKSFSARQWQKQAFLSGCDFNG